MLTEKERKELKEQLKQKKEQLAKLTDKKVVESKKVDEVKTTTKKEKPAKLTLESIQKKQIVLQQRIARLNKKSKNLKESKTADVVDFDPDLVECVKRRDTWNKLINKYISEAVDSDVIENQTGFENIVSSQKQQSGAEVMGDELEQELTNDLEQMEAGQEGEEGVQDEVEDVTGEDLQSQLKVLTKKILQLKQFADSILPDDLKDVGEQQSKLEQIVDTVEQQGQQGQQGQFAQQGQEGQDALDAQLVDEITPEDIKEAIERRNFWNETIKRHIEMDEKKNLKEGNDEEIEAKAIQKISEPDKDVQKKLQDMKDTIETVLQDMNSFTPPKPAEAVSKSGVKDAPFGDVAEADPYKAPETKIPNTEGQLKAQRQQIIMQQKQIKQLNQKLAQSKAGGGK